MADKTSIRFVSALLRQGAAEADDCGGFCLPKGETFLRLPHETATALVRDGVLAFDRNKLKCRPEARNWLRRARAQSDNVYADQHRITGRRRDGAETNLNESPVARLGTPQSEDGKSFLKPHHLETATRLRALFEKAQLRRSVTVSYDANRTSQSSRHSGVTDDVSDMAIDARKKLDGIREILPRDCFIAVYDICCLEKGLQRVESEQKWPRRSAKIVLRIGLDQVAAEFGLTAQAVGPDRSKRAHGWMATDGRPTIVG